MAIAEELVVQIRAEVDRAVRDIKKLDKEIGNVSKSATEFGKRASQLGTTLTRTLTLPIAAAAGAAVKFATDAQESINAVNVVFGQSADVILAWGENAAQQAGLSRAEFNQASTVIGAALQNAGVSADDAADSAINLTRRAADMASVFNTDVDQALGAIQAALRGEIDPIERFGVSMNAASVEAKALELGLADASGEMTDQSKIAARLAVIMEQTERVAGDFANTSDELANNTRVMLAELKDTAAELGENLLPIVNRMVSTVGDLVERFGNLSEEQQNTILVLAGVAAAAGPATKAIGGLSTAIGFLAANPIVAAIAGVAALTVGIVALSRRARENQLQEIAEEFAGVESAANLAREEIEAIEDALRLGSMDSFTVAADQVEALAENLGVSKEAVVDIGLASDNVTDQYKEQLQAIKDQQVERIRLIALSSQEQADRAQYYAALAAAAEIERQRADEAARAAEAERQRLQAFLNVDAAIRSGLVDERTGIEAKLKLRQDEVDRLEAIAIASGRLSEQQQRELSENRAAVVRYQARLDELDESINNVAGSTDDATDATKEFIKASVPVSKFKDDIDQASSSWIAYSNEAQRARENLQDMLVAEDEFIITSGGLNEKLLEQQELMRSIAETGITSLLSGFEQLGEAIVDNGDAYKALGKIAVNAIAQVLKALGNEYAIRAVAAAVSGNFGAAAGYGAVSAGAYTASGVVSALASRDETAMASGGIVTGPTRALIGEQGPEAVIPLNRMGSMGGTTYVNAPQITVQGSMIHERQLIRYISGGQARMGRGY